MNTSIIRGHVNFFIFPCLGGFALEADSHIFAVAILAIITTSIEIISVCYRPFCGSENMFILFYHS